MEILKVNVHLTQSYSVDAVRIYDSAILLQIPLNEGENHYSTIPFKVGDLKYFKDPVLQAMLTVWYKYNKATKTITLCSPDLKSKDATYLTTFPRNSEQFCKEHTYPGDNKPCGTNPNWNYTAGVTPGLKDLFHQTVRKAQEKIIEGAKAAGLNVIIRTPPPVLSKELNEQLAAVYHKGVFLEMYNPQKNYADPLTEVLQLESVWYGEVFFAHGEEFANVKGSSGDPKIAGLAWLRLWESHFGVPARKCTSHDHYSGIHTPGKCGSTLVGGHVIQGTIASHVPHGSDGVFIMPICTTHNNSANDRYYMQALEYTKGIALEKYHQR